MIPLCTCSIIIMIPLCKINTENIIAIISCTLSICMLDLHFTAFHCYCMYDVINYYIYYKPITLTDVLRHAERSRTGSALQQNVAYDTTAKFSKDCACVSTTNPTYEEIH